MSAGSLASSVSKTGFHQFHRPVKDPDGLQSKRDPGFFQTFQDIVLCLFEEKREKRWAHGAERLETGLKVDRDMSVTTSTKGMKGGMKGSRK